MDRLADRAPSFFSPDYATARRRFLHAAAEAGWTTRQHPVDGHGPEGESLSIDIAASGGLPDGAPVLIVSSGLHGVEGAFGSAVQLAILQAAIETPHAMSGVRCVLLHALNPYGFAWSRRTDARNVDLNRAFATDAVPEASLAAIYARVSPLLNPSTPPRGPDLFSIRLIAAALRHGPSALRRAVASGQRMVPEGLFFTGTSASVLQQWLRAQLPRLIGSATTVVHLDVHTGLGRRGQHQLIVDYPLAEPDRTWLSDTFGAARFVDATRTAGSYVAQGSLGQWCVSQSFAPHYRFAFAECGTYGSIPILAGLRDENRCRRWLGPAHPRAMQARARLRELFCPASPEWRRQAIVDALEIVRLAAIRDRVSSMIAQTRSP